MNKNIIRNQKAVGIVLVLIAIFILLWGSVLSESFEIAGVGVALILMGYGLSPAYFYPRIGAHKLSPLSNTLTLSGVLIAIIGAIVSHVGTSST